MPETNLEEANAEQSVDASAIPPASRTKLRVTFKNAQGTVASGIFLAASYDQIAKSMIMLVQLDRTPGTLVEIDRSWVTKSDWI